MEAEKSCKRVLPLTKRMRPLETRSSKARLTYLEEICIVCVIYAMLGEIYIYSITYTHIHIGAGSVGPLGAQASTKFPMKGPGTHKFWL